MLKIERDTILVGISELRNKVREILKEAVDNKVVLEIRNRPQAVIVPIKKYEVLEKFFDLVEDEYLGSIAKRRSGRKNIEYISSDEMEKLVGL